jgi:hypothetical protein
MLGTDHLFNAVGQLFDLAEYILFRSFLLAMFAFWIYRHWKHRKS